MGMYTELFVEGQLKEDAPQQVADVVRYLFGSSDKREVSKLALPDHEFFTCSRWSCIGSMSSFYHVPFALSGVSENHTKRLCFISRSDLKNYENEIALFLDWLKPYCEQLRGWSWYEECTRPTLFDIETNVNIQD